MIGFNFVIIIAFKNISNMVKCNNCKSNIKHSVTNFIAGLQYITLDRV